MILCFPGRVYALWSPSLLCCILLVTVWIPYCPLFQSYLSRSPTKTISHGYNRRSEKSDMKFRSLWAQQSWNRIYGHSAVAVNVTTVTYQLHWLAIFLPEIYHSWCSWNSGFVIVCPCCQQVAVSVVYWYEQGSLNASFAGIFLPHIVFREKCNICKQAGACH